MYISNVIPAATSQVRNKNLILQTMKSRLKEAQATGPRSHGEEVPKVKVSAQGHSEYLRSN